MHAPTGQGACEACDERERIGILPVCPLVGGVDVFPGAGAPHRVPVESDTAAEAA